MSDFTFEINGNVLRNADILEYFENDYPYDEISEEKRDELYDVLDEMIKDAIVSGYIDSGLVYAMQELDWFYVDLRQVITADIKYYDLDKSYVITRYVYNINDKFYSLETEEGVGWTEIAKQPHEVRAKQVVSTIYEEDAE
jgi:hypothetical protein